MYPLIVADIGGTNARFALVTGKENQQYTFDNIHILSGEDFQSFEDALSEYISRLDGVKPTGACAAVAGPVGGDVVSMTNLSWSFSCKAVAEKFGFSQFLAMNDFGAVASAASHITEEHLINIKPGERVLSSNRAVFGAGTGLGVAGVINNNGSLLPLPSEGGHVNIAPATDFEAAVIKAAIETHGHVSAESFLSGPGLINLYNAIVKVNGQQANDYQPADITKNALEGSDELCLSTLETFCSLAGAFAGNLALTYAAKGGVYIAGGIMPRFSDFLKDSAFVERFQSKGVMSHFVENIPVDLITHPEIPFTGAAAWFEQQAK